MLTFSSHPYRFMHLLKRTLIESVVIVYLTREIQEVIKLRLYVKAIPTFL